jgi:LysR family transcriptional regulator, hypochlorite-specific transcription factor HypT
VHLSWLGDFVALAESKSFLRAAALRNVTPPAFGRRIRALESWFGTTLVNRADHPLTLTEEGEAVLEVARSMVRDLSELRERVTEKERVGSRGLIRIATGRTIARTRLPAWLGEAGDLLAQLDLRVMTGSMHDAAVSLLRGDADFLVTYFHPRLLLGIDPSTTEYCVVGDELLAPVSVAVDGAPRYRLPGTKANPVPHVKFRQTLALARIENEARRHHPRVAHLASAIEVDSPETALEFCLAGMGMAWLPLSLVRPTLESRRLVLAAPEETAFPFEIRAYRLKAAGAPFLEEFWAFLRRLPAASRGARRSR